MITKKFIRHGSWLIAVTHIKIGNTLDDIYLKISNHRPASVNCNEDERYTNVLSNLTTDKKSCDECCNESTGSWSDDYLKYRYSHNNIWTYVELEELK
jgi:hypothetical protein